MVGCPVALDPQQVAAGPLGVHHRQVDSEAGRTHLVLHVVSLGAQRRRHRLLEGRVRVVARRLGRLQPARLGVLQVRLEGVHAPGVGSPQVQVRGDEVAVHHAAAPRPRDQDVEPPFASLAVEGPEVHGQVAPFGLAVAHADEDHVPLVSLDVLQVLHEERLLRMALEERLDRRVLPPQDLHLVLDSPGLGQAEGRDAQGELRPGGGVLHDGAGHRPCFVGVDAPALAPLVVRLGGVTEGDSRVLAASVGAGEDHQPAVVELVVGDGDQRFVAASVVPAQHPFGRSLGAEHPQNALQVGRVGLLAVAFLDRPVEEGGGRELLAVSHDHRLPPPHDGAHGVHRAHLAGLVEDHHVEAQRPRRNVLRDRERAHHEDRLDALDGVARADHELAHGQVAALLLELAPQHRQLAAAAASGNALPVQLGDQRLVVQEPVRVQTPEALDDPFVGAPVELRQDRAFQKRALQPSPVEAALVKADQAPARARPRGCRLRDALQAGLRKSGGDLVEPGDLLQRAGATGGVFQPALQLAEAPVQGVGVRRAALSVPLQNLRQGGQRVGQRLCGLPASSFGGLQGAARDGRVQQVQRDARHLSRSCIAVQEKEPLGGLAERVPASWVARRQVVQAMTGKEPGDQLPRPVDAASEPLGAKDGVQDGQLLLRAPGRVAPAHAQKLAAGPSVLPREAAPPLAAVGRHGLAAGKDVGVPRFRDQDRGVPGPKAGQLLEVGDHLLHALGLGRPHRASVVRAAQVGRLHDAPRREQEGFDLGGRFGLHVGVHEVAEGGDVLPVPFQRRRGRGQALGDGPLVGGQVLSAPAPPVHVLARHADRGDQVLGFAHRLAGDQEVLAAPRSGVRDLEPGPLEPGPPVLAGRPAPGIAPGRRSRAGVHRCGRLRVCAAPGRGPAFGERQLADQLVGRETALADGLVDRPGVVVQSLPPVLEQRPVAGGVLQAGLAQRHRASQLVQQSALVGGMAVQLQAGVAHVHAVQSALHHLEGGQLLRHEEHGLAPRHGLGDQVRDHLRLARPRRSLHDQVAPVLGVHDRQVLGAVRVQDVVDVGDGQVVVQVVVLGNRRRVLGKAAAAEEGLHHRVPRRPLLRRPHGGVQVLVDQQLAEGEEAQSHGSVVHAPAVFVGDGLADLPEVLRHVQLFAVLEVRQRDVEVAHELGRKGEVGTHLLAGPLHLQARPGGCARKLHGHENQRRRPGGLACLGFVPLQHPQRQVEDVDALLFDRRRRVAHGVAQPHLQPDRVVSRLEPVVHVPIRGAVAVRRGLGHQRQQLRRGVVALGLGFGLGRGGVGFRRRLEVHRLLFADQHSEDFPGELVDDIDALRLQGPEREQRVAQGQVQQLLARPAQELRRARGRDRAGDSHPALSPLQRRTAS